MGGGGEESRFGEDSEAKKSSGLGTIKNTSGTKGRSRLEENTATQLAATD